MQVHLNIITPRWKKLKELNKTVRRSIIPKMRDEWIFARSLPGKVGITVPFLLPLCKLRVLDTRWLLLFMTVLCNMAISTRCETCYIAKFGCLYLCRVMDIASDSWPARVWIQQGHLFLWMAIIFLILKVDFPPKFELFSVIVK